MVDAIDNHSAFAISSQSRRVYFWEFSVVYDESFAIFNFMILFTLFPNDLPIDSYHFFLAGTTLAHQTQFLKFLSVPCHQF